MHVKINPMSNNTVFCICLCLCMLENYYYYYYLFLFQFFVTKKATIIRIRHKTWRRTNNEATKHEITSTVFVFLLFLLLFDKLWRTELFIYLDQLLPRHTLVQWNEFHECANVHVIYIFGHVATKEMKFIIAKTRKTSVYFTYVNGKTVVLVKWPVKYLCK